MIHQAFHAVKVDNYREMLLILAIICFVAIEVTDSERIVSSNNEFHNIQQKHWNSSSKDIKNKTSPINNKGNEVNKTSQHILVPQKPNMPKSPYTEYHIISFYCLIKTAAGKSQSPESNFDFLQPPRLYVKFVIKDLGFTFFKGLYDV